jgi:hypothetical protein
LSACVFAKVDWKPHANRADQEVIKAWDPNALEKVDYARSLGFAVSSRNGFSVVFLKSFSE